MVPAHPRGVGGMMFLTPEEIYKVTGKTQPAAQIRHLRRMGIRAERSDNPDAPVFVAREWLTMANPAPTRPLRRSEREQAAQAR